MSLQSSDVSKIVQSYSNQNCICECGTVGLCPCCNKCEDICCQCDDD